jgi:hypothetical protein
MGAVVTVDVSDSLENPSRGSTALLGPRRERRFSKSWPIASGPWSESSLKIRDWLSPRRPTTLGR